MQALIQYEAVLIHEYFVETHVWQALSFLQLYDNAEFVSKCIIPSKKVEWTRSNNSNIISRQYAIRLKKIYLKSIIKTESIAQKAIIQLCTHNAMVRYTTKGTPKF